MPHWIIRVGDGKNLSSSKFPIWGVKSTLKSMTKKMVEGDVLWFLTSKKYGGKFIGMAEFIRWADRRDEPFLSIDTISNEEQGWINGQNWDIQIHYRNFYNVERQNISAIIQCAATILNYETFKSQIPDDLYHHHHNFTFYATPKLFDCITQPFKE